MRLNGFNDIISVNSIIFFIEPGGPVTFGSQGDGAGFTGSMTSDGL